MIPPHAYVPGRTPRHDEAMFADVRSTVRRGMTEEDLAVSAAWSTGLDLYDQGFFWECHEVLEAVWMAAHQNSRARFVAQAVIQLANARLKLAMGRVNAARRLADIAAAHLAEARLDRDPVMGLTPDWLRGEVSAVRHAARGAL
ncbi:DUF309 domain-containing protein [Ovoidimarina sediminis]|uniref:DUF309 domain-containing protein n=1 Tax=Ovoidimarina sediminis TaxID=3079856 RepID=UPI002908BDC0|nr:DUF309 domain-containing protein [Rhodophyticola sp. MJ-SS7]MDU8943133.1 DUF309 domain-containing protein [Rhodophyticola sp. MJ-SS7]